MELLPAKVTVQHEDGTTRPTRATPAIGSPVNQEVLMRSEASLASTTSWEQSWHRAGHMILLCSGPTGAPAHGVVATIRLLVLLVFLPLLVVTIFAIIAIIVVHEARLHANDH